MYSSSQVCLLVCINFTSAGAERLWAAWLGGVVGVAILFGRSCHLALIQDADIDGECREETEVRPEASRLSLFWNIIFLTIRFDL